MASFPTSQAIVVGGGLGGMSAANTVVENGGRVVLLVIWLLKKCNELQCFHQFLLVFFFLKYSYSKLCSGQVFLLWWKQHQSDLRNQWRRQKWTVGRFFSIFLLQVESNCPKCRCEAPKHSKPKVSQTMRKSSRRSLELGEVRSHFICFFIDS